MTADRHVCPAPGCREYAARNGKETFCRHHTHCLRALTLLPSQSSWPVGFKITTVLNAMVRGTQVYLDLLEEAQRYLRQNPVPEAEGHDPDAWMVDDDER